MQSLEHCCQGDLGGAKVHKDIHNIVDSLLAPDLPTVKQQLVSRFVSFVKNLQSSRSPEVRIVASMMIRCARSTTGRNLLNIEREVNLDPLLVQPWQVKEAIRRADVPHNEGWRWHYLGKLLDARRELNGRCEDTKTINELIEGLCSS